MDKFVMIPWFIFPNMLWFRGKYKKDSTGKHKTQAQQAGCGEMLSVWVSSQTRAGAGSLSPKSSSISFLSHSSQDSLSCSSWWKPGTETHGEVWRDKRNLEPGLSKIQNEGDCEGPSSCCKNGEIITMSSRVWLSLSWNLTPSITSSLRYSLSLSPVA